MDISMKRTQRDYSLSFKLSVVEQVEKGELSCQQAQDRYGIQGRAGMGLVRQAWARRSERLSAIDERCHDGRSKEQDRALA